MATILFGWEMGGGYGHVRPLLTAARALAAKGHKPVFAVRNLGDAWSVLRKEGFPVLQAPFWQERPWRFKDEFRARTFGDILGYFGWDDPEDLEAMVRPWDALLDLVRPGLIVVDHAPALVLAGYKTIPVVQIGTGFSMPPHHLAGFPVFNPHARTLLPESVLLASVSEVQRRRGRPVPPSLPAMFSDGAQILTVLTEFDPYRAFRASAAVGPLDPPPAPVPLPAEPRWFAYLGAEWKGTGPILGDLVRTGIPGEAFLRGASPELRARFRAEGVSVVDEQVSLKDLLPRITVLVHHAGIGFASAALGAGRAQLLLPAHLEQWLTAESLKDLGVGIVPSNSEPADVALVRLIRGEMFTNAAKAKAESIRDRGPWEALPKLVAACEAQLAGAR